jgi:hypothetical protein
MLLQESVTLPV